MEVLLDTFEYFMSFLDKWRIERLRQKYSIQRLIEQPFVVISKDELEDTYPNKSFKEQVQRKFLASPFVDDILSKCNQKDNLHEPPTLQKLISEHVQTLKKRLPTLSYKGAKLAKVLPIQKSKDVFLFLLRFEEKGIILGSVLDITFAISYKVLETIAEKSVDFNINGGDVAVNVKEKNQTFICNVDASCKNKSDKIATIKSQLKKTISEEWINLLVNYDVEPREKNRTYLFYIVERIVSPFDTLKDVLKEKKSKDVRKVLISKESVCKDYVEVFEKNIVDVVVLG